MIRFRGGFRNFFIGELVFLSLFIFGLLPSFPFLCSAGTLGVKKVAVKNFFVREEVVTSVDADYLMDLVRGEIRRALDVNRYNVLTDEIIDELLSPRERREYIRCGDRWCDMEFARKVKADFLVSGEIIPFAGEIRVMLRLRDISNGSIISEPEPVSGKNPASLERPVKERAAELASVLESFVSGEGRRVEEAELVLRYSPSAGEGSIYGTIDERVMVFPFDDGSETLRLPPGKHIVKLVSNGRAWGKEFDLKAGDQNVVKVIFPAHKTESLKKTEPGNLYIETEPEGAEVVVNGVLRKEKTPLTLYDIPPGEYVIELSKAPFYLPGKVIVDVEPVVFSRIKETLKPNFGKLIIESEPSGAMLYLKDELIGTTPYNNSKIVAGEYPLRLMKPFYHDEKDEIDIVPGSRVKREYVLKPQFGKLKVDSEPNGARVEVDGRFIGVTPVVRDTILSGTRLLRVVPDSPHYRAVEEQIEIIDGGYLEKNVNLPPDFGTLTLKTDPPGAAVMLDGPERVELTTPVIKRKLIPGLYSVSISKDSYLPQSFKVMVIIGKETGESVNLVRMTGNLRLSTEPQGAKIRIGDKKEGETPMVIKDLPTGHYKLRLVKEGFDIVEEDIEIKYGETKSIMKTLSAEGTIIWKAKRAKARKLALILPGAGQFVSGQYKKGLFYTSAFIGSLAWAARSYSDHCVLKEQFDDAHDKYENAVVQSEIDKWFDEMKNDVEDMEKLEDHFFFALYTAGGIYTIQLLDALVWGGGPKPVQGRAYSSVAPYSFGKGNIRVMAGVKQGGGVFAGLELGDVEP